MAPVGKDYPLWTRAFSSRCANCASNPATSPLRTLCLDIFSRGPGDSKEMSQPKRLGSSEIKIRVKMAADSDLLGLVIG